jgi:hypothetical protein
MTTATGSSAAAERLHGLDAVRGYALLLGVVFHATMSFLPGPHQVWPVRDTQASDALAVVFFVSHTFRMTTFFLIAGFFAHLMVAKRGVKGFVRDRLKRIALPMVVGWPILLAGILAASVYAGWVATGHIPTRPPAAPNPPPLAFPLTHLWFLYVLLWLYSGTLLVRWLVTRSDPRGRLMARLDGLTRFVAGHPLGFLAPALVAAVALNGFSGWLLWFGFPTPDNSLIPNLPAMVEFALAFGLGWMINRQPELLAGLRRRWAPNLAIAVVAIAACLGWIGLQPVVTPQPPGVAKLAYALGYTLGAWSLTYAVIGLALRFLADHSPARRYIADSSYWIYLVHLPLVMALQAAVSQAAWPWEVKFAVILGVGFTLMFASYHLLVRRTVIGAILNGRRIPRAAPAAPAPVTTPEAVQ